MHQTDMKLGLVLVVENGQETSNTNTAILI